mmetsp:Transcript_68872/g.161398  ORF Transcript_68872/g.161398 Transcript_68872/m.161398 type:complete len:224 (-) Transcript_68872:179-850(-)
MGNAAVPLRRQGSRYQNRILRPWDEGLTVAEAAQIRGNPAAIRTGDSTAFHRSLTIFAFPMFQLATNDHLASVWGVCSSRWSRRLQRLTIRLRHVPDHPEARLLENCGIERLAVLGTVQGQRTPLSIIALDPLHSPRDATVAVHTADANICTMRHPRDVALQAPDIIQRKAAQCLRVLQDRFGNILGICFTDYLVALGQLVARAVCFAVWNVFESAPAAFCAL